VQVMVELRAAGVPWTLIARHAAQILGRPVPRSAGWPPPCGSAPGASAGLTRFELVPLVRERRSLILIRPTRARRKGQPRAGSAGA